MSHSCFKYQCLSHLEEESISHWVAEAEDKVFLGVFGYGLDNAVLHPQCMFRNTVMVDPRTTIRVVQAKGAALREYSKQRWIREKERQKKVIFLLMSHTELYLPFHFILLKPIRFISNFSAVHCNDDNLKCVKNTTTRMCPFYTSIVFNPSLVFRKNN